jgi:microcystin-dependent protein
MADQFIGEIRCFGFTFAPVGWAMCNGQLLPIQQNTALFSLLGTQYGGDGVQTFGLPNLQSRVPVGQGQGPGLSNYTMGEIAGVESHSITINEMGSHAHLLLGTTSSANDKRPKAGSAFAQTTRAGPVSPGDNYYATPGPLVALDAGTIQVSGSGGPHVNLQPFLTVNFCIALVGIFPARN